MKAWLRRPEPWVFVILFLSYAYYWQARDWNSASRFMLTYAVVDRGTISIDGLEKQTGDLALVDRHYYTDKFPGISALGVLPYALARWVFRFPPHPLGANGIAYWPADYWVTLGTSGLLSALAGAILANLARSLGCGPRRAALVGLAYGLATPAYAYATMFFGHQAAAFCMIASFALLWKTGGRAQPFRVGLAGFLAAYASVIELAVGPVSAILALYLLGQVIARVRKPSALGQFAVGALLPTIFLLLYNQLAFGSPLDTGYSHLINDMFKDVHTQNNPLGLRNPEFARGVSLLWGRYRGLLFYAPITGLTPFGLIAVWRHHQRGMAVTTLAVMIAVFLVNLSYPAWTGGWTTGPRLLVPLLPFALLPVAGLLAVAGRWTTPLALVLAISSFVVLFLFVGVGGQAPQFLDDPLLQFVWPRWRGERVPLVPGDEFFARNVVMLAPWSVTGITNVAGRGPIAFLPLAAVQVVAIALMLFAMRGSTKPAC